jgi:hypothetical protein
MTRFLPLVVVAAVSLLPASRCIPDPNPPEPPPPATGGYWPTPPVTGGSVATGGTSGTGGTVSTGGRPAPTDPVDEFCWRLHDLGCPEGVNVGQCVDETESILALGPRASLDLSCVINAQDQYAVRACESVACGGVQ